MELTARREEKTLWAKDSRQTQLTEQTRAKTCERLTATVEIAQQEQLMVGPTGETMLWEWWWQGRTRLGGRSTCRAGRARQSLVLAHPHRCQHWLHSCHHLWAEVRWRAGQQTRWTRQRIRTRGRRRGMMRSRRTMARLIGRRERWPRKRWLDRSRHRPRQVLTACQSKLHCAFGYATACVPVHSARPPAAGLPAGTEHWRSHWHASTTSPPHAERSTGTTTRRRPRTKTGLCWDERGAATHCAVAMDRQSHYETDDVWSYMQPSEDRRAPSPGQD